MIPLVMACSLCALYVSRGNPAPPARFKQEPLPSPSQVVQSYWELAQAGRLDEARRLETNTKGRIAVDWGDGNPPDSARSIYESGEQLIRIVSEKVKGNRAQVLAEVRNYNGTVRIEQAYLHREQGEWKIYVTYSYDPLQCELMPYMCELDEE